MLRPDGKVEDLGDFSDFYIPPDNNMNEREAKHLREMQDEVYFNSITYLKEMQEMCARSNKGSQNMFVRSALKTARSTNLIIVMSHHL